MSSFLWEDVTSLLQKASKELTVSNPMLHSPNFSLFEAMSACEIMDPNTDQCLGMETSILRDDSLKVSFPDCFGWKDVSLLLQTMIRAEISCYDGASIMESTHLCTFCWEDSWKYLDDSPISRLIKGFSRSHLKTISNITKGVLDGDIYEDEDFLPSEISKNVKLEDTECLSELDHLVDECCSSKDIENVEEILSLLKARKDLHIFSMKFYDAVSYSMRHCHSTSSCAESVQEKKMIEEKLVQLLDYCKNAVSSLSDLWKVENDSDVGALPVDEIASLSFCFRGDYARSTQSGPKRKISFLTYKSSLQQLETIAKQIESVGNTWHDIQGSMEKSPSIDILLNQVIHMSMNSFHLFSRCIFYCSLHYFFYDLDHIVLHSLKEAGFPDSLLQTELFQSQFSNAISRVFWDTFRYCCVHPNRLLVRLESILPSWGTLLDESAIIDRWHNNNNNSNNNNNGGQWCSYWTMLICAKLMDYRLHFFLQYQLLAVHELASFYWYWDYICNIFVLGTEKLRRLKYDNQVITYQEKLQATFEILKKQKISGLKSSGKKNLKSLKEINSSEGEKMLVQEAARVLEGQGIVQPMYRRENEDTTAEEYYYRAKSNLCKALFRLFVVANRYNFYPPLDSTVTSAQEIFSHRFQLFYCFPSIGVLSYEDFCKISAQMNDAEALSFCTSKFTLARSSMESMKKLVGIQDRCKDQLYQDQCTLLSKSIIANQVNSLKFGKIISTSTATTTTTTTTTTSTTTTPVDTNNCFKITLDSKFHPCFPVIDLISMT